MKELVYLKSTEFTSLVYNVTNEQNKQNKRMYSKEL